MSNGINYKLLLLHLVMYIPHIDIVLQKIQFIAIYAVYILEGFIPGSEYRSRIIFPDYTLSSDKIWDALHGKKLTSIAGVTNIGMAPSSIA